MSFLKLHIHIKGADISTCILRLMPMKVIMLRAVLAKYAMTNIFECTLVHLGMFLNYQETMFDCLDLLLC